MKTTIKPLLGFAGLAFVVVYFIVRIIMNWQDVLSVIAFLLVAGAVIALVAGFVLLVRFLGDFIAEILKEI